MAAGPARVGSARLAGLPVAGAVVAVRLGAADGLVVESGVLVLPALAFLAYLELSGAAAFGHEGTANVVLIVAAGFITAGPLLLFAGAARRVPLVTLGLLQYIAPTLQFLLGVLVFDEDMPRALGDLMQQFSGRRTGVERYDVLVDERVS